MQWSEETVTHLKEHLPEFPAKGSDILAACGNMMDVKEDEKAKLEKMLDRDKLYESLDAVMADLDKPAEE